MSEQPEHETSGEKPADDEAHRKFREALDRKKQAHHATSEAAKQTGVGPSQNAKTTRQFRRKSGG